MWPEHQDLVFSFKMALRSALRVIRGMRKSLTDEQQDRVAEMMVEDLRRRNWGHIGAGGNVRHVPPGLANPRGRRRHSPAANPR